MNLPLLMDPLRFSLALGPLAVYFLVLGVINLRRRPWLTTGARDTAALGVALCGLVVVGPLELFLPDEVFQASVVVFGFRPVAWMLLLAFYSLTVTLIVLQQRPRLTIYNVSPEELRPALSRVVHQLDPTARWVGNSVEMRELGLEFHIESFALLRNVSLVSVGERQSFSGWRRLERALSKELHQADVARNAAGAGLVLLGFLLIMTSLAQVVIHPAEVTQAVNELLRLPPQ
jgi:uncharacterized membrane protein